MSAMFSGAGYGSTYWSIGNLKNWNTSNVTTMSTMFGAAGNSDGIMESFGELTIYNAKMGQQFVNNGMFSECNGCSGILNILGNPTSYKSAFYSAATKENASIVVNYSTLTTNIDRIINTKSTDAHIVKGILLDDEE